MSVYLNPITNGIMVASLIIYSIFIPILIHQYRKYGTLRMRGNLVIASFILYMITAWFMTVLPLPSFEAVRSMESIRPNFTRPFLFVDTFFKYSGFVATKPGTWISAICSSSFFTVAFNIVLTIPFGVYLRKYFIIGLPIVALLGLSLSFFYEMTQYTGLYGIYPKAYRFADVDDLIVNTIGAVVGYFLAGYLDKLLPNPAKDHAVVSEKVSFPRRLLCLLVDYIVISIVFELSRLVIYRDTTEREWDLAIFLVSQAIVFILLPLLTKKKQTVGMLALKLYFQDKKGQRARVSRILLHNIITGIWLYVIHGMMPGFDFIVIQLLFSLWLLVMIIESFIKRKVCYYWEPWLDSYLQTY